MTADIDFDIVQAGGIKSMIFGGEGVFFARLRGPGKVWIQSLPFSRLAGRMLAAAGPSGGQSRGEGSILGACQRCNAQRREAALRGSEHTPLPAQRDVLLREQEPITRRLNRLQPRGGNLVITIAH